MKTSKTIMVQIADRVWTQEAVHCASRMARSLSSKIVLVQLIPVQHMNWLGTELGYMNYTAQERDEFADYQATIEDYGVECSPLLFQYTSLAGAMMQAADYENAQIIFAKTPESIIPFWGKFQIWLLNRQFASQKREWIQYPIYGTEAPEETIESTQGMNGRARYVFR